MMTYDVLKPIVPLLPPRARLPDPIILHDPRGNFIAKRCSAADRHVVLVHPPPRIYPASPNSRTIDLER